MTLTIIGQRVLPHRNFEPLHRAHKPLFEAFAVRRLSSYFMSCAKPEFFKRSNSQMFGEPLSLGLEEAFKFYRLSENSVLFDIFSVWNGFVGLTLKIVG